MPETKQQENSLIVSPEDVAAVKLLIRGEVAYPVLGDTLHIKPFPGGTLKAPSRLMVRAMILEDRVVIYREGAQILFDQCVSFWGELTFEDLWRDPEIAMDLFRKIARG